jgi:hypothetical protein
MPSLYETTPETGTVSSTNLTSLYSNTSNFTTGVVNSSVYSVNGGTGVTVNPTTGNVVVSIGQDVATTANVSFANVTATGNLSNNYFTLVNSAGTNGQVLTTNGAGVTTWTTPSSLGLVTSITGTANQIIASSPTGAVTLSTPQDIATTSNPTFAGATLGNVTVGVVDNNTIATTTGNLIIGDFTNATNYPVLNSGAGFPVTIQRFTTGTSGIARSAIIGVQSSGTPTVGFGNSLEFQLEAQPGNTERVASINVVSTDLTAGSEDFRMNFGLMQNGASISPRLSLFSNGDLNMYDGGQFGILGLTSGGTFLQAPATGSFLTYTLPGAAGAASTVLTNDGSGNLSWDATGNPFDQSLNTTDYVEFAGVKSSIIEVDELRPFDSTTTNVSMITTGIGTYQTGKSSVTVTESASFPDGLATIGVNSNIWYFLDDGKTQFPNYTLPAADGTANQVLTTDGSGNVSWALPGGGGSTFGNITIAVDTDNTISTTTGDLTLTSATGTVDVTGDLIATGSVTADSFIAGGVTVYDGSGPFTTSTTAANQVASTTSATGYRSLKYIYQITSGTEYQVVEIMIIHDGTTAYLNTYGDVRTGANLSTFDADISGGLIRLLVTPTNAVTTYKGSVIAVEV